MESVSAGSVQAITGAILSYSSSASAPNLDPIAFKEAGLARLKNGAAAAAKPAEAAKPAATPKPVSRSNPTGKVKQTGAELQARLAEKKRLAGLRRERAHSGTSDCEGWARAGECIRNPQYMFSACGAACELPSYLDLDKDCASWANSGECEANAAFMLQQCNSSCLADEADGGSSRLATFLPIFFFVLLLGCAALTLSAMYAKQLSEAQDRLAELWARFVVRTTRARAAGGPAPARGSG
ncbi:hypothetical protein EMIHUDRAFT_449114 [Emiliania huxleyi CCMP1516]|uniref:ShKT domain-containing protein n=2 Tax=Emiliania huxleyi TaxID=2903 RepID=A0A0D3KM56_EMIH1|nr:hypothetical protein EMIHUDRAFT_449114 [Emiliania huxleyi CCMP1516]EOD36841.1 hypothetical protein EMIHUDRAFT_449114 [Emiliania huxleyi CCMP1516]|eukprot:XP_005789270.1 hypothetical protein EMIHUDRAFT_449114 [Emiliania huxleyi CCMP1516]